MYYFDKSIQFGRSNPRINVASGPFSCLDKCRERGEEEHFPLSAEILYSDTLPNGGE